MEKVIETRKCFMNVEVPKPLERKARIKAAELGVSRSEFVRLAVIDYLKRLEVQPAPAAPKTEAADGRN